MMGRPSAAISSMAANRVSGRCARRGATKPAAWIRSSASSSRLRAPAVPPKSDRDEAAVDVLPAAASSEAGTAGKAWSSPCQSRTAARRDRAQVESEHPTGVLVGRASCAAPASMDL